MKCKSEWCNRKADEGVYCYVCEEAFYEARAEAIADRRQLEVEQNGE